MIATFTKNTPLTGGCGGAKSLCLNRRGKQRQQRVYLLLTGPDEITITKVINCSFFLNVRVSENSFGE
jgi:hypothetical protein